MQVYSIEMDGRTVVSVVREAPGRYLWSAGGVHGIEAAQSIAVRKAVEAHRAGASRGI